MISIIVPTHNRQSYLEKTLIALSNQKHIDNGEFEVIVVDDASEDETEEIVKPFFNLINLVYIKIESSHGNPSLVRNVGIKNAKGKLISFIDCGVVMNCDFVATLIHKYCESDNVFVIHEIYGLFADVDIKMEKYTSELLSLKESKQFTKMLKDYSYSSKWVDRRKELFSSTIVYTPWCYAWSCALTVSKEIIEKSGLFDESFKGWGSEDVDFGYRCYLHGANFIFDDTNPLFHIPHPTAPSKDKEKSNRDNRLIMHEKNYAFETEIFLYTFSTHMQAIMSFYDSLILRHVLPEYNKELWNKFKSDFLCNEIIRKALFIGAATAEPIESLGFITHAFYLNKKQNAMLQTSNLNIQLENQLGCSTKYTEHYFDAIVITDIYRILTDTYLIPFLKEMNRIGKKIYLTYNKSYAPYGVNMYGLVWRNSQNIIDILPNNLKLVKVREVSDTVIYSLEDNDYQE